MVTKTEVAHVMFTHFPSCPLCNHSKGYKISGMSKDFIQCRSCGAKWQSNYFWECKELKTLHLREPSRDGRGASLKKQNYLVTFWQDSDAIKRIEEKKSRKGLEEEERAKEIEELFRKLKTKDMEVRSEVQNKLGEIGQPVLVKIDKMLEDGYSGPRKEASLLLGLMGDKSAVETLTQVLKRDVDEGVRCKAVISLGLIEEAKKSGKTIETLIKILKNDFHPNVRETAAIVLSLTKEPMVINALIQALNDSQATVPRLRARLTDFFLPYLSVIRDARARGKTESPTVGHAAALSLVNIGKPAVNPLTQAMKKYNVLDVQVRELAEEVLRCIRASDVDSLIEALKDEDKDVRKKVVENLGRIGDARVIKPLTQALKDEDKDVRLKAAKALKAIKDPEAVEPLIQALKDECVDVRETAAYALGDIGDARALEALTQAKEDKSWFVRSAAKGALKEIQKK